MSSVVTFYHYTSADRLEEIKASGFIKETPSHSKYAHFGQGVYGSSLHPHNGPTAIAIHNWGQKYPVRVARAIKDNQPVDYDYYIEEGEEGQRREE